MLAVMSARARDGQRALIDGDAGLAISWLNATAENVPPLEQVRDGTVSIVADCRLDNRHALLAALREPEDGQSDALLIVQAYLRWGTDCVERLTGDFAFAIRDAGNRTIFCARDHVGVKPFYYLAGRERFVFASDIKGIFAAGGVERRVDDGWVAAFLAGLSDDYQATPYADIRSLPAGHIMVVSAETQRMERYWRAEAGCRAPRRDSADEFRHLFQQSVARRMRGASVGAMLSGGLDSSSIACVAAQVGRKEGAEPLHTYSLVFPNSPGMDETGFIDAVVDSTGCVSRRLTVGDERPFAQAEEILDEQEGLFAAPGLSTTRRLYAAARADGRRVLLDGHGGDEVVSHAFVRLNELAHKRRWLELWMEVRGVSRLYGTNSIATYVELLSSFGPTLPLSRTRQRLARLRHRALGRADRGPSWRRMLNSDLLQRTELMQRYQIAARERQSTLTDEPRFHRWQVSSGLVAHAFQVLDKAAATAGIEPRYPFWDKDLLEFCLSLHPSEKLSNGWSRLVLRKAMQDILPPRIQWRTDKIDFRENLVGGMLRNHEPLLDRTFGADADRVAPYVDIPEMRAAYRRLQENPASVPMDDVLHVWRTTWLSQWLKQLERPGLSP